MGYDIILYVKFPQPILNSDLDMSILGRAVDLYRMGNFNRWDSFPASHRYLSKRWKCSVASVARTLKTLKKIMGPEEFKIIPGDRINPQQIHLREPGLERDTEGDSRRNTDRNTGRNSSNLIDSNSTEKTKHIAEHIEEQEAEHVAEQNKRSVKDQLKIPKTYGGFTEEEILTAWSVIKDYDGLGNRRKLSAKRKKTIGAALKHVDGLENWGRYADWVKNSSHFKAVWLRTNWSQIDTLLKNKLEDYWIMASTPQPKSSAPSISGSGGGVLDMLENRYRNQNQETNQDQTWTLIQN